ncbi:YlbL family protein [Calidifontibacter terrae]
MTEGDVNPTTGDGATGGATATAKPEGVSTRNIVLLAITATLVVLIAALNFIHVPYAILRPGPATNTLGQRDNKEIISISGVSTYPTSGSLDFTTVSLAGGPNYPVSVWDYLHAKFLEKNAEIDPQEMWFPKGVTGKQVQQQNTADMVDSQETAEVVALRKAGKTVPERVLIGLVDPKAPSGTALKVKDQLVSVNGTEVSDLATVHDAMAKVTPGATVALVVLRAGKQVAVQAKTAKSTDGRAVLGIGLDPTYTLPAKVSVNVGDVGGPSAGMMFTLAIYDKITPGALTGGQKVAGTGTISEDGSVGPIGGIAHKMVGAKDAGATYFLAPASDCDEVVGNIPKGMTVVKVATVDEALAAMKKIATGARTGMPACTK